MSRNLITAAELTQRHDGRYRAAYKGWQFYGQTAEEAVRKRDEFIMKVEAGLADVHRDKSFTTYSLKWLETYRPDVNPKAKLQYTNFIRIIGKELNDKPMRRIKATDLQTALNTLSSYSASTIKKCQGLLRAIFKTAFAEGSIDRNPMEMVKRPKGKKNGSHRALEDWERELICSTYQEHSFGLAALVMMYTGVRRGEALYIDIDRDVDFENKLLWVRGSVAYPDGMHPVVTEGKTVNAQRTIPIVPPLLEALQGHHGLLIPGGDGNLATMQSFICRWRSYKGFLEEKLNGRIKRWYGHTKEDKALIAAGGQLPPWKEITIRCHDFRVDFCSRCYYAGIPVKTLQHWMGHADTQLIMEVYTKFSKQEAEKDAEKLANFIQSGNASSGFSSGSPFR